MEQTRLTVSGIRFFIEVEGKEIAHAYLYLLDNDLHDSSFGFIEDVFVDEKHRGTGAGKELLDSIIDCAREEHCYKLIATSRDDGSRGVVHEWYLRLGFVDWGTEFRMNL